MLEAFGLRDEYERLRISSMRRRAALQKLLEVRESVPSCHIASRSASSQASNTKTSQGEACVAIDAEQRTRMNPNNWEDGEFTPVAARDVDKLRDVIASLQSIEGDATTRLRDEDARVTWHIEGARKRLTDERRLAHGRSQLTPKRVLVESPWLKFGSLGSIIFRMYPKGDGTALPGGVTIFLWMARAPGISFSFNVELGRASRWQSGKCESAGSFFATAPRLWQADMVHYRMDINWSEVGALLLDMNAEESLDLALNVLQFHVIQSPEELAVSVAASESQRLNLETTLTPEEAQPVQQHAATCAF